MKTAQHMAVYFIKKERQKDANKNHSNCSSPLNVHFTAEEGLENMQVNGPEE